MSQMSVSEETARGYEPPRLTQHSVFLENRVGRLLDLMTIFEGQALVVAGVSILDSTDHAVVRIITSRGELARRLLGRNDLKFSETEVLAVELNNGHNLASLCRQLLQVEVNVQYAYPLIIRPRQLPVLALHTDDNVFAGQILRRRLFTLLAENDLGENATGNTPGPGSPAPGSPGPGSNPTSGNPGTPGSFTSDSADSGIFPATPGTPRDLEGHSRKEPVRGP